MSVENEVSLPIAISDVTGLQASLDTKVEGGANDGIGATIFKSVIAKIMHFKTLIAGTNISFGISADEITINASGGGSATITEVIVNVPTAKKIHTVNIVDAGVGAGSQIMIIFGNVPKTDQNEDFSTIKINALPLAGSFDLTLESLNSANLFGNHRLNYLVG